MAESEPTASGVSIGASGSKYGNKTLPELFSDVAKIQETLENTDESTASDTNQRLIKDGVEMSEVAIRMINELSLFSINEEIEEVQTAEIKYMLMSAYLAYLHCLNTHIPRKDAVQKTILCYKDYLRLVQLYGVVDHQVDLTEVEQEGADGLPQRAESRRQDTQAMSAVRNNKIQRFKEKKALQSRVSELRALVEKEHVDDEVRRDFYLTQIKHWAVYAVDEIDSCALEMQMLKHRDDFKKAGKDPLFDYSNNSANKPRKPFRPFILTKDRIQKGVFGAGYPALPCMTVDEFYEEKVRLGQMTEHGPQGHSMQDWAADPEQDALQREKEDSEKEKKIEEDDEEQIARMRAMDDWKDEHRRGDGNRHNKG